MNISSQKKFLIACTFFIILGVIPTLFSIAGIQETASLRSTGKLEALTVIDVRTKQEGRRGFHYVVPIVDVRGANVEVSNSAHDKKYLIGDIVNVYATTSGTPFARFPNSDNKVGSLGEEFALAIGVVLIVLGSAGIISSLSKTKK